MINLEAPVCRENNIKGEWEKFVDGKSVDREKISTRIYESWNRCREYGLDPFKAYKRNKVSDNVFVRDDEASKKNSLILSQFRDLSHQNGFELQLYDNNSKIQTELMEYSINDYSLTEQFAGTNAVSLAFRENQPVMVMGYEHYLNDCHDFYCSATPISNRDGKNLGAINLVFFEREFKDIAFAYSICAAKILEVIYANFAIEDAPILEYKEIKNLIEGIPQGFACIDSNNAIRYYNERILDILHIDKKQNTELELKRRISIFNSSKEYCNREITIDANGTPKNILVSTKDMVIADQQQRQKLIFLDNTNNKLKVNYEPPVNAELITFNKIIGKNPKLLDAINIARKAAKTELPVLINGESGTGKEIFAQAIHNASPRRKENFIAINCGAIPTELVESELFGYEPGAFTGALRQGKKGHLEAASGGTLFLDEIESMPMHVQIKLLRALSAGKILKIGGTKESDIDVRIISATKKDLLKEADNDRFREDLYYRINTITIDLPPLRDRKEDIPILAMYFINKITEEMNIYDINIQKEFLQALPYYYWRGNVRELENVIQRSIKLLEVDDRKLNINTLPNNIVKAYLYKSVKESLEPIINVVENTGSLLKSGEEIIIEAILKKMNFNMNNTAEALGISRKTLYNKIHSNEKLLKLQDKITGLKEL